VEKWLLIPDHHVGWILPALWPAWRCLRKNQLEAIFTTSPPASPHLLGLLLKRVAQKPWVMDLRDPWTFEPMSKHLRHPGMRLRIERAIERLCFENADAIILNTPAALERYRGLYPRLAAKMSCITNGFDAGEIEAARRVLNLTAPWQAPRPGRIVISHAGSFHRFSQGNQRPEALLNALGALKREGALGEDDCRLIFAGPIDPDLRSRCLELGLGGVIEFPGIISHFDSIRLFLSSDWLLLYDPDRDGGTYIRGKLYDYLGCGKPILGIVPAGASRDLLECSGRGLLADPGNERTIREALGQILARSAAPSGNAHFPIGQFEGRALTGKLAGLLDEVTGRKAEIKSHSIAG
jgi:glycosyltransferase involved in cell wall biosynthesis